MKQEDYQHLAEQKTKNSPIVKDCVLAFIIGGLICLVGQGISDLMVHGFSLEKETAASFTSITLVFLSAIFTGFGLYAKLAKYGGAGTLVPITGFANAVVSPAIEFKAEGIILGMAPKMFIIAGPVIVFGTIASAIYGVVFYILHAMGG